MDQAINVGVCLPDFDITIENENVEMIECDEYLFSSTNINVHS